MVGGTKEWLKFSDDLKTSELFAREQANLRGR